MFVSTASFGDKSQKSYDPHKVYRVNDNSSPKFSYYEGKISVPYLTDQMLLVEDRPSMANKLPKNNSSEIPIIYLDKESVVINPVILTPKFYELTGTDLSDLTSPLNYSNYTVKKSRTGKTKISFDVNDNMVKKHILLTVSPSGKSQLTITSHSQITENTTKFFKGFIAEI